MIISAIENNLQIGMHLVRSISNEQYRDTSTAPYHSSIGGHIRHILDIFDCIFCGLNNGQIDLTARSRNLAYERQTQAALLYFDQILTQLSALQTENLDQIIEVKDDLGQGLVSANYTLAAVLIQAHSHAIHHFASLGYIAANLQIDLPHVDFGFNPTTPRNAA